MPKSIYILEKPLFLLGFMGSGKSTVGKILSKKLSLPFTDMDIEIEKRLNSSVNDIFKVKGEDFFRKYENNLLKELLQTSKHHIIAGGGGTPCYFNAIDLINQKSISIYLNLPLQDIVSRLKNDNTRPMLQVDANKQIQMLFFKRESIYQLAKINISAKGEAETIAEQIIIKLLQNNYIHCLKP